MISRSRSTNVNLIARLQNALIMTGSWTQDSVLNAKQDIHQSMGFANLSVETENMWLEKLVMTAGIATLMAQTQCQDVLSVKFKLDILALCLQ